MTSYLNLTSAAAFSIEQVWSFIKQVILRGMNLFIPKVREEDRRYPKWFNSTIKCLRTLRRNCSLNPTHNNSSKLLSLESHLTSLMNSAQLDFENNLSTQNSSNIFKYIKSLSSTSSVPPILCFDSSTGSSDSDKACLFNT